MQALRLRKNADILCLKLESTYVKTEKSFAGAIAGKFETPPTVSIKFRLAV